MQDVEMRERERGQCPELGDSSFNSPRQKSGLVHKGGGGGTLSPDFS